MVFAIATLLYCGSAMANPVDFTFTGTGIHGTQASGSFTTSTTLAPFYFATGSIYSAFSLTLTDIPGSGPSSVTFDGIDLLASWLNVDGSGNVFIAPFGAHDYGAPFYDYYALGQPSQPGFPGSYVFETQLTYDLGYRDTITWSVATPASSSSSAVPETGSTLVMLLGAALTLIAGSYRRGLAR